MIKRPENDLKIYKCLLPNLFMHAHLVGSNGIIKFVLPYSNQLGSDNVFLISHNFINFINKT